MFTLRLIHLTEVSRVCNGVDGHGAPTRLILSIFRVFILFFLVFPTGTGNIVVIMISYPKGREILDLVQKGIPVTMTIGIGMRHVQEFINSQSVVFVAIAFITMMIISLAWLIFYYIQRFLYTGSQFGRQVTMANS